MINSEITGQKQNKTKTNKNNNRIQTKIIISNNKLLNYWPQKYRERNGSKIETIIVDNKLRNY